MSNPRGSECAPVALPSVYEPRLGISRLESVIVQMKSHGLCPASYSGKGVKLTQLYMLTKAGTNMKCGDVRSQSG